MVRGDIGKSHSWICQDLEGILDAYVTLNIRFLFWHCYNLDIYRINKITSFVLNLLLNNHARLWLSAVSRLWLSAVWASAARIQVIDSPIGANDTWNPKMSFNVLAIRLRIYPIVISSFTGCWWVARCIKGSRGAPIYVIRTVGATIEAWRVIVIIIRVAPATTLVGWELRISDRATWIESIVAYCWTSGTQVWLWGPPVWLRSSGYS